jgi:glutathione synthase
LRHAVEHRRADGDWFTQINVTSPTAIREIARFGGADIAAANLDAIEARRA